LYLPSKTPTPAETKSTRSRRAASSGFTLKMEVTIPARIESISPLVESVMAVVRTQARAKELEIETALREALANAIKHGCSGDPSKFVQCQVVFEEGSSVLLVVSDPGAGFDPKSLPDPTVGKQLYKTHGRGIYLINHLMDEVRFKRRGAEIHMRSHF
jgi:serine/threonine-protein kinase RsbW